MIDQTPPLDLTDCDREPIHIPGTVQPHGLLLVLDPESSTIRQIAGDAALLGRPSAGLLGHKVEEILGPVAASWIQSWIAGAVHEPNYLGSIEDAGARERLDLLVHRSGNVAILELEPESAPRESVAEMLAKVSAIGATLAAAPNLERLCEAAAREVRRLTGFDRVTIYRFLGDGTGQVLAEEKRADLPPYLNHHYPASDVPKQARALYVRNRIRVIPDVSYAPAPLVPPTVSPGAEPLDMSDCVLRSVSPIHIQYLKNMGVAASMSVSIVPDDGVLWGLVACLHGEPKRVGYETREACKHVAQILSQQIRARDAAELHDRAARFAHMRDVFVGALSRTDSVETALLERCPELCALLPADGVAVLYRDEVARAGHAPSEAQIRELVAWLLQSVTSEPFATDSLSARFGPASAYAREASGVLATIVSRRDPLALLWFRVEHAETVEWAGNPHKPIEPGGGLGTLNPRKSFELWREIVRGRSRSWSLAAVDGAARLRDALVDLRQRQHLRDLNAQLRRTLAEKDELLAQKDLLMQEVNHRVQNSLQLVNAMLGLQARQTTDPAIRTQFDEASRRIMAVSMLHHQLWQFGRIESVDFDAYLKQIRQGLIEAWGSVWEPHLAVDAGPIQMPTGKAVILALIMMELITNAAKYAYGGEPGPIDVRVTAAGESAVRAMVADRGLGMGSEPRPSGLGTRLVRALVAQLGGGIATADNAPGTRVTLTIPLPGHDSDRAPPFR
jgi:light-regulated signal transduction histidine kinase (bacteriophytochrome)